MAWARATPSRYESVIAMPVALAIPDRFGRTGNMDWPIFQSMCCIRSDSNIAPIVGGFLVRTGCSSNDLPTRVLRGLFGELVAHDWALGRPSRIRTGDRDGSYCDALNPPRFNPLGTLMVLVA